MLCVHAGRASVLLSLLAVACVLVVYLRVCFVVGAGVVASAWLIVCGVRCACDVLCGAFVRSASHACVACPRMHMHMHMRRCVRTVSLFRCARTGRSSPARAAAVRVVLRCAGSGVCVCVRALTC